MEKVQIGLVSLLALTAAAHLVLGGIIYNDSPRNLLNRLCLGFAINASLWSIAVLLATVQQGYTGALFWIRASHAIAVIMPWFIVAFAYCFSNRGGYPYQGVFFLLLCTLAMAFLSMTPAIIKDIIILPGAKVKVHGTGFPLYLLTFIGLLLFSLYHVSRQLSLSRGLVRYQIRYFFGGSYLSFIFGGLLNLLLPAMGFSGELPRGLGPVFSLLSTLSISYAIVRYRLMDIKMALRRILAYMLSIALLIGIYILLFLTVNKYFVAWKEGPAFYIIVLTLLAVFFQPLKEMVRRLVDRYFYRSYHYFDSLQNIGKAMVSILRRDDLTAFLVDKVVETIYLQGAALYLRENGGFFQVAAQRYQGLSPSDQDRRQLPGNSPLFAYLEKKEEILLRTDLKGITQPKKREILAAEMKKLQAEAVVPLIVENRLEGVFSLSFKISGEPYSQQDVGLLAALASQVAVALKNAQLYQDVWEIKRYLENILENMGNGLIAVNDRGFITTFNSAAENLTGITAIDALGKDVSRVLDYRLGNLLLRALAGEREKNGVELGITAGGQQHFLSCHTVQVVTQEEGKKGAILVISDITKVKELEKEKNQIQRLVSLGELAAGMAHEIKNPLASIQTFAELLPEKYDDHEFRYSFSRIVKGEIERINELVMKLLNFTHSPPPFYTKVDPRALLEEIMGLLSPQLAAQKIRLFQHYARDIPPLKADRDQLKQALLNICLNGVQAMPKGGELHVQILPLAAAETFPGNSYFALTDQKVKIRIRDTGKGISTWQKERVFDPFFTTKSQGMGIGLSISHKIITEHGGTVRFHSDSGGTVFKICLPVVEKKALQENQILDPPVEKGDKNYTGEGGTGV
ncbi:MAG: ATP-binding protein [Dethiobacteria bacterium]